jgi:pyruvate dehydrogenase E1 component alpha subunit
MGHSMSDPVHGVYRTKEEVEEHREHDPIKRFIDRLQGEGLLSEEQLNEIDARVHAEVDDAAEFADASPEAGIEELYTDVYAQHNEHGRLFFGRGEREGGAEGPRGEG